MTSVTSSLPPSPLRLGELHFLRTWDGDGIDRIISFQPKIFASSRGRNSINRPDLLSRDKKKNNERNTFKRGFAKRSRKISNVRILFILRGEPVSINRNCAPQTTGVEGKDFRTKILEKYGRIYVVSIITQHGYFQLNAAPLYSHVFPTRQARFNETLVGRLVK